MMPPIKGSETWLMAETMEITIDGLADFFRDKVGPEETAHALAFIIAYYTSWKVGALVGAPPDFLQQIVEDVTIEMGVVVVNQTVPTSGGDKPN